MSRVLSFLNLAYRFNLHMLKKPFAQDVPGKELFLANYRDDFLVPLDEHARDRLPDFERCLSCGLCDAVCDKTAFVRRHLSSGPSDLASSLSRHFPDYLRVREFLEAWDDCDHCNRCEAVCPTGVPLRELAAFVRALAVEMAARTDGPRE